MDIDWTNELVDQLEFQWAKVLRPRIDSLTDEQYLWEPVAGCWSLRPRDDATTPDAAGAGAVVMDFDVRPPDPPPLTTIAWRMAHLSVGVFGARASNHFGDGSVDEASTDWPLSAAGGLELLDRHHDAWIDGVAALDADALARPCGPAEGPYADYPMAALVLHINREALHHGAEIALMLDLFTNRSTLS